MKHQSSNQQVQPFLLCYPQVQVTPNSSFRENALSMHFRAAKTVTIMFLKVFDLIDFVSVPVDCFLIKCPNFSYFSIITVTNRWKLCHCCCISVENCIT